MTALYRIKPLVWEEGGRWSFSGPYSTLDHYWYCNGRLMGDCTSIEDGKRQAEARYIAELEKGLEKVG